MSKHRGARYVDRYWTTAVESDLMREKRLAREKAQRAQKQKRAKKVEVAS